MNRTVTATDIANYVFCPESYRLQALGYESANLAVQQSGTEHHTAKAAVERVAGGSIAIGQVLIAVALISLVAWCLLR